MKENRAVESPWRIPMVASQSRSQWWANLGPPGLLSPSASSGNSANVRLSVTSMPLLGQITGINKSPRQSPAHLEKKTKSTPKQIKNKDKYGHLTENKKSAFILEQQKQLTENGETGVTSEQFDNSAENRSSADNSERSDQLTENGKPAVVFKPDPLIENWKSAVVLEQLDSLTGNTGNILDQLRVTFPFPCSYYECDWAFHTNTRLIQHIQNWHLSEHQESISVEEGLQIPLKTSYPTSAQNAEEIQLIEEVLMENGFFLTFPRVESRAISDVQVTPAAVEPTPTPPQPSRVSRKFYLDPSSGKSYEYIVL